MGEARFPFPTRDEAIETLKRDYVWGKIPAGDVPAILDDAWQAGVEAARDFLALRPQGAPLDFVQIFRDHGVRVEFKDVDYVSGKLRYFADYQPKAKLVNVYIKSVQLWANANGFTYTQAQNLILMHEYFHHLECNQLGMVSRRYQVPMLVVGNLRLGKTGVPSLSEIAADAFAGVVFDRALQPGA